MWQPPALRVKWGPYFPQDPDEQKNVVMLVQAARGKGQGLDGADPLITRRMAVEIVAPALGIENVDAMMDALEEEAQADADAAAERLKQSQAAFAAAGGAQRQAPPNIPKTEPAQPVPGAPAAPASKD